MVMSCERYAFVLALTCSAVFLNSCSRPIFAQSTEKELSFSDIAFIYHGVPVDKNFNAIELNRERINQVLDSMIITLSAARPSIELPNGKIRPEVPAVFQSADVKSTKVFLSGIKVDPLLSKIAQIRAAIRGLPEPEAQVFRARVDAMRQATLGLPDVVKPAIDMKSLFSFEASLKSKRVGNLISGNYSADCKASGVPSPPNWPDSAWIDRGILPREFTFASFPGTVSSSVFTYQAPDGGGVCYALPRKSDTGSIEAMGVICQSKATGKACFYDNLDEDGNRITGQSIALDFSQVRNGYSLDENCTECHRGGNAFMIHPKTPLGAIRDRDPDVRYVPIGQSTWSNPPAMAEIDSGECASCHEIGAPNAAYCGFLKQAAEKTMPTPTAVSGWSNPLPAYKAHIEFLKSRCSTNP